MRSLNIKQKCQKKAKIECVIPLQWGNTYGTALGIDPEPELGLRSDLNSLIGSLLSIFKNKKHQKM